jgi:hypothetical protein
MPGPPSILGRPRRIRREDVIPHRLHPSPEVGQPFRGRVVVAPSALAPRGAHEPGATEDGQVLGRRGLGDPGRTRQLTHGVGPATEAVEHPSPGRIGEGGEGLTVSHELYS